MKHNYYNKLSTVLTLVLIGFCLIPCPSKAHLNVELPERLIVGVVEYPPYSMKTSNGAWKGIGIELWCAVAEDLGIKYDIREYSRIKQTAEAIQAGQVDVVPSMPMRAKTEMIMDFSHAFYRSGLGIAVATNQQV